MAHSKSLDRGMSRTLGTWKEMLRAVKQLNLYRWPGVRGSMGAFAFWAKLIGASPHGELKFCGSTWLVVLVWHVYTFSVRTGSRVPRGFANCRPFTWRRRARRNLSLPAGTGFMRETTSAQTGQAMPSFLKRGMPFSHQQKAPVGG